jgi:hypothetical protein
MTNPDRPLNVRPLKHISLVANNLGVVQVDDRGRKALILRSGVKPRLEGWASGEIWVETRSALLTMRVERRRAWQKDERRRC